MDYMFPELVGEEKEEGFLFKKSLFRSVGDERSCQVCWYMY